ncbi:hypothetical protein ACFL27_06635 [candidate division CSSED10-310 bacterium]|uniref:Uncharacterized protein n=1 Tax=candidate division CSSED10-310 bacterium TaxID=2855610 RepID=A0ABV6YUL8_UNCC1
MKSPVENKKYVICLRGRLDPKRLDWFGAEKMEHTGAGDTLLKVDIRDQPALFGILEKIRNMGVDLISVRLWD